MEKRNYAVARSVIEKAVFIVDAEIVECYKKYGICRVWFLRGAKVDGSKFGIMHPDDVCESLHLATERAKELAAKYGLKIIRR